jgi:acyl-CoA reductase-like NAD-dependent aldehyde dehydrogenase
MIEHIVTVAGAHVDTRHFIGGERVASTEQFENHSPIDGSHIGFVSQGGTADVAQAVDAAAGAFPAWAALGVDKRAEILNRFAAGILERRDHLAAVETFDNGSLHIGNLKRVVDRAAQNISFFAEHAQSLAHPTISGHVADNHVRYQPAGVAALITPWNAPLMLSTWKIGPALAAGNTVVIKPPEWAPLSCSLLADIAHAAGIPAGVFNVVQGIGSLTGQALLEDPHLSRISFTGSTATGRLVGAAGAASIVPVSLELGGKSPFLVFADADLDEAAATVASQFNNAGQVCLAGTRILVEESIETAFRAKVLAEAAKYLVGDPRERGVRVGPLIHRKQFDKVARFVDRALGEGAIAILGGKAHARGGLYFEPTILTNVVNDQDVVQQEIFGPVLTWQTFRGADEAIALANSTEFGLAAVIYTSNADTADYVSHQLAAGTVWVNCFFVRDLEAPFGGSRKSGIGREGGTWSFDFFADIKNISIKRETFLSGTFGSEPAGMSRMAGTSGPAATSGVMDHG